MGRGGGGKRERGRGRVAERPKACQLIEDELFKMLQPGWEYR